MPEAGRGYAPGLSLLVLMQPWEYNPKYETFQ